MKNCWLKNKALKTAIDHMMANYFRGRTFDRIIDITNTYDQVKYVVFYEILKKYGSLHLDVNIVAETDNNGKYWVKNIEIKR